MRKHSGDEPLKLHRIRDCKIPKKTTHAYQPADRFIITTVKARVCRGWGTWVEDIFARNSNDPAIAEMSVSHMPTLPAYLWTPLSAHGMPLGFREPSIKPMFDVLNKLYREEIHHPYECGSLTARKCLSCSEYVCDGCWLDHTTAICPAVQ